MARNLSNSSHRIHKSVTPEPYAKKRERKRDGSSQPSHSLNRQHKQHRREEEYLLPCIAKFVFHLVESV